eukprot:TRINITY_DN10209_c0_g1_i1.p1 TRINITY_DN10209_c0_g1~~TRINITY_DN10209_c0_g1_i1.p1  ORF type:complete len:223 (-),score=26.37 TRINITY_DN10209_c0_g1_i1:99-737(-)
MANHFFNKGLDCPDLQWFNEPSKWNMNQTGALSVSPNAKTDFWRTTHYGFIADNGHFFFTTIKSETDVVISTKVTFSPKHQYDQAGLMVRISPNCWIKTAIEFESPNEPARLGAVVTNGGFSDWSTQDVPSDTTTAEFRISKTGSDYLIEARPTFANGGHGNGWSQIRLCRLHEEGKENGVQVGIATCCPKEEGYVANFEYFQIERNTKKGH